MKYTLTTLFMGGALLCNVSAAAQVETLKTGEQLSLSQMTGSQNFAGNTLELSGFSGVFGMSSDTAYVLATDGEARIGELRAKSGEVLILRPYGSEPIKQIFDATRLMASLEPDDASVSDDVLSDLEGLSRKQKRLMFWGLYQPTAFNVAAPGSADTELARRTIVGSDVIQNIRFSKQINPEVIERSVVSAFRDALVSGDAKAVASLMDPTPYGGSDLRGGAQGGRLLMAKRLIGSKNWPQLIRQGNVERISNDGLWAVSNGQNQISIQTRPIGDFTYISSIEQGA